MVLLHQPQMELHGKIRLIKSILVLTGHGYQDVHNMIARTIIELPIHRI